MRLIPVLTAVIPVLLAAGIACGGDEEEAAATPSPAAESETDPTPTATVGSGASSAGGHFSFADFQTSCEAEGMTVTGGDSSSGFSGFRTTAHDVRVVRGGDSVDLSILVYEDAASIEDDWELRLGESPVAKEGRTVPDHISTWWNENVVAVVRSSAGDIRSDVLDCFLALDGTPASSEPTPADTPTEVCADLDGDGLCFEDDLCPDTPAGEAVDEVGCSDAQVDQDGDGICDPAAASDGPRDCERIDDNCPALANPEQRDFDHDGVGNGCDNCYSDPNPDQIDADGDLVGDVCEPWECALDPGEEDLDGDGHPDWCDRDRDGDGYLNEDEWDIRSDPDDGASVPEYEGYNPGSCTDGVDNDGDTLIDDADDTSCR